MGIWDANSETLTRDTNSKNDDKKRQTNYDSNAADHDHAGDVGLRKTARRY
jgi:hypothetical protein